MRVYFAIRIVLVNVLRSFKTRVVKHGFFIFTNSFNANQHNYFSRLLYATALLDYELLVRHVNTEPFHSVRFLATSKNLTNDQISSLTTLRATKSWNKGDKKRNSRAFYNNSAFVFKPNQEADEFDDKLNVKWVSS